MIYSGEDLSLGLFFGGDGRRDQEVVSIGISMGIVLNYCQYGVLYLGSYFNTGPYIDFPHFGNSNLGKLPNGDIEDRIGATRGSRGLRH